MSKPELQHSGGRRLQQNTANEQAHGGDREHTSQPERGKPEQANCNPAPFFDRQW